MVLKRTTEMTKVMVNSSHMGNMGKIKEEQLNE